MSCSADTSSARVARSRKKSVPLGVYVAAYVSLLLLSALTFGLSFAHLGSFEWPAALGIASVKAVIVAWFFMHLVEMSSAYRLSGLIAVTLLAVLILFAMADVWTRPRTAEPGPTLLPSVHSQ